jgi:hypothetical protein
VTPRRWFPLIAAPRHRASTEHVQVALQWIGGQPRRSIGLLTQPVNAIPVTADFPKVLPDHDS